MSAVPIRITTGRRSRDAGSVVGVQINTFGLDYLDNAINGDALALVMADALQIAYEDAYNEWPKVTRASSDSIEILVTEVSARSARVRIQAGGPVLISDPRNKSHKDYAPIIEFNGTPNAAAGILARSIFSNDTAIRDRIREGVRNLIVEALS